MRQTKEYKYHQQDKKDRLYKAGLFVFFILKYGNAGYIFPVAAQKIPAYTWVKKAASLKSDGMWPSAV